MNEQAKQDATASEPSLTCTTRRYQLFERIGEGTTTTVHRAREHRVDGTTRIVAIKRILPALAEDAELLSGFVSECQRAARLDHPNIARILTVGRGGTGYFVSTEYVNGYDLGRVLGLARRVAGPPPIGVVAALLCELCAALDHAHRAGLAHGGLTPANLIVTRDGHVRVIDFGIGCVTSTDPQTRRRLAAGRLAYRAPEMLTDNNPDTLSDLFSVGAIAHELLTARPLFAAATDTETLRRIQRVEVAPPSQENPCCPATLDAVVLKALTRNRAERWQSAAELGAALTEVREACRPHASAEDVAEWLRLALAVAPARSQEVVEVDRGRANDTDDAADTLVFRAGRSTDESAEGEGLTPHRAATQKNTYAAAPSRWWPSLAVVAVVTTVALLLDTVG